MATFDDRTATIVEATTLAITNDEQVLYILGGIGIAALAVMIVYWITGISRALGREKVSGLSNRDRRAKWKRELSDHITNAVEDAVANGLLTREEAQHEYKRLAKSARLPDLAPAEPTQMIEGMDKLRLKDRIKYRLGNGIYKNPAKLPDADQSVTASRLLGPLFRRKPKQA